MFKRGQVFVLSALIIIFLVYSTVYTYNQINVHGGLEDFEKNVNAYEKESTMVVNDAIYHEKNGEEQAEALKNWAAIFKEGVKSADPNFGSISIYKDTDGNVHIINTLTNKSITIEYVDKDVNADSTQVSFFSIPPEGDQSKGKVCTESDLFGELCTEVKTDVSNFGDSFDYAQSIKGAKLDYICIKIKDFDLGGGTSCKGGYLLSIADLQGFNSLTQSTEMITPDAKKGVKVGEGNSKPVEVIKIKYPK